MPKKNRKPWWPHGHGDPFLYTITVQLHQNGTIKDQYQFNSGFRTVARTERGEWLINGKRLFLKGTNYIPAQWLSEMSQARYQKDIDLMKSANINAVRVHAHIVGKDFYSLADAAGVLVWQDFPLQWGYEDTESFVNNASKQAVEMIEHLQHHPSIFAWCAHNEPPWDAWWMKYKYPNYNPKQNKSLDETLVQVLSTTDPTRYSHL